MVTGTQAISDTIKSECNLSESPGNAGGNGELIYDQPYSFLVLRHQKRQVAERLPAIAL